MKTAPEERTSISLFVAVFFGAVTAAGFLIDHFGDDLEPAETWSTLGRVAFYGGGACCAAAWWVHTRYPEWLASGKRHGSLPVRNADSLRQPLWLLVASKIAPVPALGSLLFAGGIVFLLAFDSAKAVADPAKVIVGILSVAATSFYVLAVVTKRHHANEATPADLLRSACALVAFALTTQLYLPFAFTRDASAPTGAGAWICVVAVIATSLIAFSAAHDYAPKDVLGKPEETRWTYRKRKHA